MTLFEPERAAMQRVRLLVAYDGSRFHGFAENAGVATVGGTLRRHLETVLRAPIELTCAGRTDTGVHAWGQVVSFDAPADGLDLVALQRSLNGMGAPAIVVRSVEAAPADFDARFSAVWRRYRYTVLNTDVPDPFLAATTWHVGRPLDRRRLALASDPDGTTWARGGSDSRSGPTPSVTRWCARSWVCWSTSVWADASRGRCWVCSEPGTGPWPASPPRLTACASGRSAIDLAALLAGSSSARWRFPRRREVLSL
jgi:hypothetical protein